MKSLEARIAALEALKPAPNVVFVASYGEDGTLVPLQTGTMYGRKVALLPSPCRTVDEWLKRYVYDGKSWPDHHGIMKRAEASLEALNKGN